MQLLAKNSPERILGISEAFQRSYFVKTQYFFRPAKFEFARSRTLPSGRSVAVVLSHFNWLCGARARFVAKYLDGGPKITKFKQLETDLGKASVLQLAVKINPIDPSFIA